MSLISFAKSSKEISGRFLKLGRHGDGYKGSVLNLLKLLIPSINKSVYNVKDKQVSGPVYVTNALNTFECHCCMI